MKFRHFEAHLVSGWNTACDNCGNGFQVGETVVEFEPAGDDSRMFEFCTGCITTLALKLETLRRRSNVQNLHSLEA